MPSHTPSERGPRSVEAVTGLSPRRPAPGATPALADPEIEQRLRHAQRMEAVGRLAAAVAHDFNNIIQAVMGYTSFALEELPESSPARGDLEHVLAVSSRGAALVRQLLVLARREQGEPESIDLGEVVNELAKVLRRAVGEHIELKVTVEAPIPPVCADRGQIEQALVALCLDAGEAMPAGGTLNLRVRNSEYPAAAPSRVPASNARTGGQTQYVELCVADTRRGVDAQTLAQRLDPELPAGGGGGLELAEVARAARRNGGFVVSRGDPERGCEVCLSLPRATSEVGERPSSRASGASRLSVLLAEDDEQIRKIAQRTLEKAGFSVIAAANGQEALQLFQSDPAQVDVALIDVVMPKLTGTALLVELRRLRPELPALLTTGYSFGELDTGAGRDERTLVIGKPYSPKSMVERLKELVRQSGAGAR